MTATENIVPIAVIYFDIDRQKVVKLCSSGESQSPTVTELEVPKDMTMLQMCNLPCGKGENL